MIDEAFGRRSDEKTAKSGAPPGAQDCQTDLMLEDDADESIRDFAGMNVIGSDGEIRES